jgi:exodeoxyribonuclease VIII
MNTNTNTDPAVIAEIKDADYRKATGLSQSSLKKFIVQSPAHYLASLEEVQEPTKAMQFGTAFHAQMLQANPEEHFAVKKKMDGRSKEGKLYNESFALENQGKVIIDEEEHSRIIAMADSVMGHGFAGEAMKSLTHKEFAVFGTNHGIRLKGLIDGYNEKEGIVIDLKTAEDSSPIGFRKACWDRAYAIQQVHYTWLLTNAGKPVNAFYFIAVEKEPPYAVGVYKISQDSLTKSFKVWDDALDSFFVCQASGVYPAYSEEPIELNL